MIERWETKHCFRSNQEEHGEQQKQVMKRKHPQCANALVVMEKQAISLFRLLSMRSRLASW